MKLTAGCITWNSGPGSDLRRRALLLAFAATCTLLAVVPAGCSKDEEGNGPTIRRPQDFLPPGTAGMQKDGSPRIATDTASLQDIVNGGYEVYTNNGFQEMVEQLYSGTLGGTATSVKISIFDMVNTQNTITLHEELLQVGTWEEYDQIGDAAHRRTELFAHIFLFRRTGYSVRLEISNSSQDARDLVVLFATHIDQEIMQ